MLRMNDFKKIFIQIRSYLIKKQLRKKNIIFGRNVIINKRNVYEGYNEIYKNCEVRSSFIGLGTYIASFSRIINAKIGRFCAIGENVRTSLGRHPTHKIITIHPSFYSLKKQAGYTIAERQHFDEHKFVDEKFVVEIGNDVWIGNDSMIMDGVKIEDGTIIAAKSIVNKDSTPYSIIAGTPAKIIGHRFSDSTINFLKDFKWWNKDIKWLKENYIYFLDEKKFKEKFHYYFNQK